MELATDPRGVAVPGERDLLLYVCADLSDVLPARMGWRAVRVKKLDHGVQVWAAAEVTGLEPLGRRFEHARDPIGRHGDLCVGQHADPVEPARSWVAQPRHDERLLGRELAIERRLGHAGGRDQAVDAGSTDALPREQMTGRGKDPVTWIAFPCPTECHCRHSVLGQTGLSTKSVSFRQMSCPDPVVTVSTAERSLVREAIEQPLRSCRPETICTLVDTARIRSLSAGEIIYRQGEPAPMTLILEGFGISCRTTADGQELCGGVAPSGVLFGYSGIAAAISSVEFVALTDCLVAQWPGNEIRELIRADVALGLAAIDSMAGSLHAAMESIEGFLHQDARRRVIRILTRHRSLFFGDPPVLTRAHLAGLVGTTQEMTRRVLRQLEREGTLVREGRTGLRLLRPDQLEAPAA